MDAVFWTKIIIFIYFVSNSIRVFSYIPQIVSVSKDTTDAKAISLITWGFWTFANLSTALYAGFVVSDSLLALMSYGNALGCAIVIGIVVYKRNKYGVGVTLPFGLSFKKSEQEANDDDVMSVFVR